MSNETLHVATGHLRELAAKQGQAAAELTSAADLVDGVDTRMRVSHGVVAWACAGAVETVQQARRRAAHRIAGRSTALSGGLADAAARYQSTDDTSGADLDRQMTQAPPTRRLL